jgi:mannose-6-phosphate isomerase-like protein (cupin superfamily)
MSTEFSMTNLHRDVANAAEQYGLPDGFEAHFAKSELDARELGVSLQTLAPGEQMPFAHRHREQPEEIYVVVRGSGTVTVDGVDHPVATWDALHVAGRVTRVFAAGDEGLEYLAFGRIQPPNDSELVEVDGAATAE